MASYFTVKKNTNYTLTVSKSGYDTKTETINISQDTTKNITLQPSFTPETRTFNYTGAVQTYTVPQGTTKLIVDCVGAASKQVWTSSVIKHTSATNGKGGRVQCKLTVSPGQVLNIYVGGNNAYNGGGSVKNGSNQWCYGGGASDIRIGGTALSNRKVVAGGGGCGIQVVGTDKTTNITGGAGGGTTGGAGWVSSSYATSGNGKGGTQSAGGAGGSGTYMIAGVAGSLGKGGGAPSGSTNSVNLAGGGGYYGGGSSAQDEYLTCGGGGGGSSYTDPNLCSNVTHTQGYSSATGNGWITITTSNE